MDRGAWGTTVHQAAQSQTQLSDEAHDIHFAVEQKLTQHCKSPILQ